MLFKNQHTSLQNLPNVTLKVEPHYLELPFLSEVFQALQKDDLFFEYDFYYCATAEQTVSLNKKKTIVFLTNEKAIIPSYIEDVFFLFNAYEPKNTTELPKNYRPFPLGYNGEVEQVSYKSFENREWDLFYAGQIGWARWHFNQGLKRFERSNKIHQLLNKISLPNQFAKAFIHRTGGFNQGLNKEEYAKLLMNTKIIPCPEGTMHPTTFRFFEAARFGNIILSHPLPKTWYYDPFPGIILEDWKQLGQTVRKLIANPERMFQIHQNTLDYYEKYCSPQAVAKYIIEQIKHIRKD